MTLFLIIFIIFACVQYSKHSEFKHKSKVYHRLNTSNASKQYDVACTTIKDMGFLYRDYVTTMDIKDFMGDDYNRNFYYFRPGYIVNNDPFLKYCSDHYERMWVVITAKALNIEIDNNCLNTLYKKGIWELIPKEYSDEFKKEWVKTYSVANTKQLEKTLRASIILKNFILCDNKGNSYSAYNNSKAIDYVASAYSLPTNEEKRQMSAFGYNTLQDLCYAFTLRQSKIEQYKHIPLTMICINPTEEQKKIQYAKLSQSEMLSKQIREEAEMARKYSI